MALNIIVRDKRPDEQRKRADFSSNMIKGYYNEECNQTYRDTNRSKGTIKGLWESFEHDKAVERPA